MGAAEEGNDQVQSCDPREVDHVRILELHEQYGIELLDLGLRYTVLSEEALTPLDVFLVSNDAGLHIRAQQSTEPGIVLALLEHVQSVSAFSLDARLLVLVRLEEFAQVLLFDSEYLGVQGPPLLLPELLEVRRCLHVGEQFLVPLAICLQWLL